MPQRSIGIWEYSSFWNWASASGFLPDVRTVDLNLGKGFGGLGAATENCFFIDMKKKKELKALLSGWIYKTGNTAASA